MTLKEAREVRDMMKAYGLWSVVPLGQESYFARINVSGTYLDFHDRSQARKYLADMIRKRRISAKARREAMLGQMFPRPRSPIEAMIDKACGL